MITFSRRKFLSTYLVVISLLLVILLKILTSEQGDKHNYFDNLLSCDDFKHLSISSVLGEGWTKSVSKGSWRGVEVAVKTVNEGGHAMKLCEHQHSECVLSLQKDLIREAKILQSVVHPNIIKLYGSCFPHTRNASSKASLIVELGEPLDSFTLVQKDFKIRLQLALDISSLLFYLGSFPSGGILLPDLRLQQFVIVNGILKLCDVDGFEFGGQACVYDSNCTPQFFQGKELSLVKVRCSSGKCVGLNDSLNVWRTCRTMLPYLLSFGAPKHLESSIEHILECKEGMWSSLELKTSILELINAVNRS